MDKNKSLVDNLDLKLVEQANQNIMRDLFANWCEANLNLIDFDSDSEWAEASGIAEIKTAFNTYYNLTPEDTFKYLN
jgi:hypothetical protein